MLQLDGCEPITMELKHVTQRRRSISRGGDRQVYDLHLHFELRGRSQAR